jgi:hypothetical protein
MMAQLGHMDRETSLEYVHIQNRALERAKQLIESEQAEILASAQTIAVNSQEQSKAKRLATIARLDVTDADVGMIRIIDSSH